MKNEVAEEEPAVSAVPFRDDKKIKPKKPSNPMAKRENLVGWLFCSPIIIGILVFTALPVILSLISMFYDWDGLDFVTESEMVGFQNFVDVFTDPQKRYLISLKNMLVFSIQIPIGLFLGMFLGIAMNRAMKGVQTFRILYYLPSVMSIVAITIVFQKLFDYGGYINNLFGTKVGWLITDAGIGFTVNFMMVWKGVGYTALMYVAGLQSVSTDQLEAAKIDGANSWVIFYKITLPALYPITFYLLVTGIMGGLQVFNEPYILAEYGTGVSYNAMTPVSYVNYFRQNNRYGVAAVAAWFLALLILIVTMIQMYFDNKKDKEA